MIRILGELALWSLAAAVPQDLPESEWTILFYVDADSNLELFQLKMLEAVAAADPSDRVRLVLQIDRAENDDEKLHFTGAALGEIEGFSTCKRIEIRDGQFEEIEDLGEMNLGRPESLADFIAWGIREYPAKRVALVLSDHGIAWAGALSDLSHKPDRLTLPEIQKALDDGCRAAERDRLDLIYYECCLMASLEVARVCQARARYLVASEDLYWFVGTPDHWRTLISGIATAPDVEAGELAKRICACWKDFYAKTKLPTIRKFGDQLTISAVDLQRVPAIVQSLDGLCEALAKTMKSGGREAWLKIASSRNDAEEYGRSEEQVLHCRDLHDFVRRLAGPEAEAVRKAVEAAVVARANGSKRPNARGLSICFPGLRQEYDGFIRRVFPEYPKFAPCGRWESMLNVYYELAAQDTARPDIRNTTTTTAKIKRGQMAQIRTSVKSDDVAEAIFFLAMPREKFMMVIGQYPVPPKELEEQIDFDGTWLAIGTKGKGMNWAPIVAYNEVGERTYIVGMPARYTPPRSTEATDVLLHFSVSFNEKWKFSSGKFLYAYSHTEEGPSQVSLHAGGTVKPIYTIIEGEKTKRLPAKETLTVGKNGLEIAEIGLPAGKYHVGYRLKDFSGNEAFDKVEITVEE